MEPLKIAMFCIGKVGGSTEVAMNLAVSLARRGHHCEMFAYDGSQARRLAGHGIELHSPQQLDYPLFENIQSDFGFLVEFDASHKVRPFDIVHVHYAVPFIHILSNLRDVYNLPSVLTFHGSDVTIVPDLFDFEIVRKLLKASGATVTVASQFLAGQLRTLAGLGPECVRVIPNTVSPEFFEPFDTPARDSATPYFIHVSNLRPVKRVGDIVLAMCSLRQRWEKEGTDPMPRLKIVGEGPDQHELKLMIGKCNLGCAVDFVGRVGDKLELRRLVAGARALVLSSLTESQPITALEAMAVGTPVVCSRFTAAPELIGQEGERGWLFDLGDSRQLSDLLFHIATHPAEIEATGRRARDYAELHHSEKAVVDGYIDYYLQTIGAGSCLATAN